jgi:N-acetylmuramoyl-L-alanine amidase
MIKKCNIFLSLFLILSAVFCVLCSFLVHKDDPKRKVKIIVIDPGHGGKDPGCNGVSCREKDVALSVSLKLGKLIEEHIKDVKVIYTRKTDVFVELEDRARIANENNADLFISIHCNAAGKPVMIKDKKTGKMRPKTFKNSKGKLIVVETANPEPYGSETYVMGLKNEEGKMKVAQRENSAMLLEDNYETKYQGFDPNSEESYIIMSNYTSSYVIQSAGLALKIQEQYSKKAGRVDKGVHRQSIWVLWRTSMPSVLTEIGYLTNPEEEKFLGSDKGQTYIAACLFRAFRKYKDEQEGIKKTYDDAIENQVPLENENFNVSEKKEDVKTIDAPVIDEDIPVKEVKRDKTLVDNDKLKEEAETKAKLLAAQKAEDEREKEEEKKANDKLIAEKNRREKEQKIKSDSIAKAIKSESIEDHQKKYKQLIAIADVNYKNKNFDEALTLYKKALDEQPKDAYAKSKIKELESTGESVSETLISPTGKEDSEIIFKVQFASTDKEQDTKVKYPHVPEIWFYKSGALIKYTSGNFSSIEEASKHQAKLKELGYKDCFIAAFKKGVRMDINEARKHSR